jgi:hypothetical protein
MSFCHADIPSKPGTPNIVDWDVDRVDLKWEAPKSNGGAAITGYIIEKKEKFGSSWDEILTTTVRSRMYLHIYANSYYLLVLPLNYM